MTFFVFFSKVSNLARGPCTRTYNTLKGIFLYSIKRSMLKSGIPDMIPEERFIEYRNIPFNKNQFVYTAIH